MTNGRSLIPAESIERRILLLRRQKVMLDADLAELYGVPVKVLNQAVNRNTNRFPSDFMFQLSKHEFEALRSQIVTSNRGRGGRRYHPYAFTEHGVAMLSSVLNSEQAVQVNIAIMRAFMRLRQVLSSNKELAPIYPIRQLMAPPDPKPRRIGFRAARSAQAREEKPSPVSRQSTRFFTC